VLAAAALAAQGAPSDKELQALRERIESLQKDLDAKESERRGTRDALRESERAISDANRTLAQLDAQGRQLRTEAGRIAEQRKTLERAIADRQATVERLLVARQALAGPDVLRAALSGDEPADLGRRLVYMGYVSRAAAALLNTYRADLESLERLARDAQAKRDGLRSVEQAARADRARIVREREARRRVLDRTAGEIRQQRRQISVLKADETRLSRLIEGLGRVLGKVESVPGRSIQAEPFSKLRGSLRLPVRGELTGRFGAPRGASGVDAKGVFIRAPEGQPVRAIARGQVVYADWMRGFGNLLIVDHGENYLSIYANNEALLTPGGAVGAPGAPAPTTGASGGNEETGLYFELRHLGRAFDPLRWVKLK
jgi:septal ring factor EnvC (AmiA/AmiB activator)